MRAGGRRALHHTRNQVRRTDCSRTCQALRLSGEVGRVHEGDAASKIRFRAHAGDGQDPS